MKKNLTALLLALAMTLSLAACGAEEGAASSAPAASSQVDEPASSEEAPAAPGSDGPSEPVAQAPAEGEGEVPREEERNTAAQAPAQPTVKPQPIPEPAPEVPAEPETPAAPAEEGVDLGAFYLSLVETYGENFPANMNLCDSAEMLEAFYPGLAAVSTNQMMVYQPMMGAVVCEIALVEVAGEADVETVKGILQSRIDAQVEGGAWYPESIEGWKNNSRVVANGNCVMMIAYSECDAIVEQFNGLF